MKLVKLPKTKIVKDESLHVSEFFALSLITKKLTQNLHVKKHGCGKKTCTLLAKVVKALPRRTSSAVEVEVEADGRVSRLSCKLC